MVEDPDPGGDDLAPDALRQEAQRRVEGPGACRPGERAHPQLQTIPDRDRAVTAGEPPALDEELATIWKQEAQEAVGAAEDRLASRRRDRFPHLQPSVQLDPLACHPFHFLICM